VKVAPRDRIDRILERLAAMPAVEKVDPLAEGISDRISVINRHLMLQSKRTLNGHGITWRDWQVLTNLLLGGDTPRSPGDLASTLMVTTGAMTNVLDRLEEAGLIRRVRNPADRRSVIVEATDDGMIVRGGGGLRGGTLDARGDHRLALLGAVAGLASAEGVTVRGFEAAKVSYPGFERDLSSLISR
jgi:DNA-binding transcriptional ArsR family regulator